MQVINHAPVFRPTAVGGVSDSIASHLLLEILLVLKDMLMLGSEFPLSCNHLSPGMQTIQ